MFWNARCRSSSSVIAVVLLLCLSGAHAVEVDSQRHQPYHKLKHHQSLLLERQADGPSPELDVVGASAMELYADPVAVVPAAKTEITKSQPTVKQT